MNGKGKECLKPTNAGQRFNRQTSNIENHRTRNYKRLSLRLHDYGRGTGGHIGCAEILKQHYPNLKVFAVEPEASPVISGAPGPHPLQGIGRIYPN
jgi:cysteine synthase A